LPTNTSIWPDLVRGLPTALTALVIGLIAAGIAYRQYQVAQAKLNLELFEHRYALYEVIWDCLAAALDDRTPSTSIAIIIPKARFLFGSEIAVWLETLETTADGIRVWKERSTDRLEPEEAREEWRKRHSTVRNQVLAEMHDLPKRFAPYMDFAKWR
jgi:hypothetical protein